MKVCFPATFVAGVMLCLVPAISAQVPGGVAPGGVGRPAGGGPAAAAPAGPPAAAQATTTIAVIDIAKIFKGHHRFNQMMGDIKKDIEEFDGIVKAETGRLKSMGEALQQYKTGSLEYKTKEEELARLSSDLQVKVGLKKKELLEQEARVYYSVYRELENTVARFAQANRITMVLRFNSEDMKEEDRNSVLQGVNRAVVYYHPNLDVTNYVLFELNKDVPAPRPPVQPQVRQPGAPGPAGINAGRPQIPPTGVRQQ